MECDDDMLGVGMVNCLYFLRFPELLVWGLEESPQGRSCAAPWKGTSDGWEQGRGNPIHHRAKFAIQIPIQLGTGIAVPKALSWAGIFPASFQRGTKWGRKDAVISVYGYLCYQRTPAALAQLSKR